MVAAASIPAHPTLPPEQVSRALEVLQSPDLSLHDAAHALGLTLEQLTLFLASPEADELLSLAHSAAATRTRFCVAGTLHKSVAALTKVLDECNAAPAPPPDAPPEALAHRDRQLAAACRASSILLRLANLSACGTGPRPTKPHHGPPPRAARTEPPHESHHEPRIAHAQPTPTRLNSSAPSTAEAARANTIAPSALAPLSTAMPIKHTPACHEPTHADPPRADQSPCLTPVIPTIRTSATNAPPPTPLFLPPNASPAARLRATSGAPP